MLPAQISTNVTELLSANLYKEAGFSDLGFDASSQWLNRPLLVLKQLKIQTEKALAGCVIVSLND